MTRKGKLILLALTACSVAAFAAACGSSHTHTAEDSWAFDAESHWHPSSCSHDVKLNKSEHDFEDIVVEAGVGTEGYTLHVCACGYSYRDGETDPLPAKGYNYDGTDHWTVGGEKEGHSIKDTVVEATCAAAGYTKHECTVCGYWYATDPTALLPHTEDDTVWAHDGSSHWHPCLVCGQKSGVTSHTLEESVTEPTCDEGGFTEFSCDVCGYSAKGRETAPSHTFGTNFESNEFEHWHPAICEHEGEKADIADHILGEDGTCTVCGKKPQPRLGYLFDAEKQYYIVTGIGTLTSTEIEIPATVNEKPVGEIAPSAFEGGTVVSVAFAGNNLKKIGAHAFKNTQIASSNVTLPESVEEIGAQAFMGTNLSGKLVMNGVTKLGQAAFRDTSLVEVEAAKLSVLRPEVFEGCENLTKFTGKPVEVQAQAFAGCAVLNTVDLSECEAVGFSAFEGCAALEASSLPKLRTAEEYAFTGSGAKNVTMPLLKAVPDRLFLGCEALVSVDTAAEYIGVSAFEGCSSLSSVTLTKVKTVGENAFKGATALTTLSLPESIYRVGENAFTGTGLIKEESGVQYAANVAVGCTSGTSVTLKAGTVGVADGAFRGKTTLTSVHLDDSVRFVGANAFRGTTFKEIDLKKVSYIGANAFRESGLTSVTVPSTVEVVGDNAFYDCNALSEVTVGAKKIGKFAFSYTGTGRDLDDPVKDRPTDGVSLKRVTFLEGVESIGSNAFQYAKIVQIVLPQSLKEIGAYAFAQTGLINITIPSGVERIGAYAFFEVSISSATFENAEGWKAGNTPLDLSDKTHNATYFKTTYVDYEWVRG